jgi:hypothetical protein
VELELHRNLQQKQVGQHVAATSHLKKLEWHLPFCVIYFQVRLKFAHGWTLTPEKHQVYAER